MKLWWTERAVLDRDAIFDFISADSSRAAVETDERFAKQAGLLTTQPGLGRISRVKGLRELVVGTTSLSIRSLTRISTSSVFCMVRRTGVHGL